MLSQSSLFYTYPNYTVSEIVNIKNDIQKDDYDNNNDKDEIKSFLDRTTSNATTCSELENARTNFLDFIEKCGEMIIANGKLYIICGYCKGNEMVTSFYDNLEIFSEHLRMEHFSNLSENVNNNCDFENGNCDYIGNFKLTRQDNCDFNESSSTGPRVNDENIYSSNSNDNFSDSELNLVLTEPSSLTIKEFLESDNCFGLSDTHTVDMALAEPDNYSAVNEDVQNALPMVELHVNSRTEYNNHNKQKNSKYVYSCDQCFRMYNQKKPFKKHLKSHFYYWKYQNKLCSHECPPNSMHSFYNRNTSTRTSWKNFEKRLQKMHESAEQLKLKICKVKNYWKIV